MKKKFAALAVLMISPLVFAETLADPLVGYWKMESTNGPVVVDSAKAGGAVDDGTWVGTPTYTSGPFGNALRLGGNSYLDIPDSVDTNKDGEDLTISVWCRVDRWRRNDDWLTVLAKGESNRYRIARYGSDRNKLAYAGGAADISGGSVNDSQWHHLVGVTKNGVEARFYVDGELVGSRGPATLNDGSSSLLIGANPDANGLREWKGDIDDVGLFDQALEGVQIESLYAIAKDPEYGYDLGRFNEMLKLHAQGPGGTPVLIDETVWVYAAANPENGSDFFVFGNDGSGVVANAPVIESFSATPQFIAGGNSTDLKWETDGFTSLSIDDGNGPIEVTDLPHLTVTPASTTVYTLTGTSVIGESYEDVTVYVDVLPSVELTASDDSIVTGGSTSLLWESMGASSLTIDQDVGDVMPHTDPTGSGSIDVSGITAATIYTISATNAVGTTTDTVTVSTGEVPVINSFTLSDENPVPGATIELSWSVSGAETVEISPAVGVVNPESGTVSDTPTSSTTYTLTASNAFGSSSATVAATIAKAIGIDSGLWTVTQRASTGTVSNLADADSLLAGNNVADSVTVTGIETINYGKGNAGEFPGDAEPPLGDDLDDFVVQATATLVVNFPTEYVFGINNDDGGRLRIDGADVIVDDMQHGTLTSNGSIALAAGAHLIEYVYFERSGDQAGEVFFVNGEGSNEMFEVVASAPSLETEDVIINEFMADNDNTLDDAQGDSSDWIELYNGSGSAIDLMGYYLTDDIAVPDKYAIPSYSLEDGEFLVIFASGKNTVFGDDEFHANFKLSANGEYLGLYRDDGAGGLVVVSEFAPAFPPQEEDASYGTWGVDQELGYMPTSTPGGANLGGVDGFLGDTHFDVDRGLFEEPFSLIITTDNPSAEIRYTLDGTEPTINHGEVFSSPILISETSVVRAAGFFTGWEPTNVDTHTYIFPEDIPRQDASLAIGIGFPDGSVNGQVYRYGMEGGGVTDPEVVEALKAIPSVSLVIEQEDFSSSSRGIFSNAGSRGSGWERPGSIELLNEGGQGVGQFQIDCGVRIRGGFSRSDNNPKHAFRLYFRGSYGGDLEYPIFQDEGPSRFEKLDLRTSQNYSWSFQNSNQNTFLREVNGRDAQRDMGQPYTRSRYYHLYINGVYWGLYMSQERAESSYGETYFGGDEDDYDVIKSSGNEAGYVTEATDGDLNGAWADLWTKVRGVRANPDDDAAYFALQGLNSDGLAPHPDLGANPNLLEVDNMIDYLLAIFYTGNFDAPLSTFVRASNNWFGMRDRNGPDGFRFFVHDGEHSLGTSSKSNDRVGPWGDSYTDRPPSDFTRSNPQYLHEDLAWNEEYRIAFADRVHKHFFNDGPFTQTEVLGRFDTRYATVDDAVHAELARWGGDFNYSTWLDATQDVVNFVHAGSDGGSTGIGRAAYMMNLFRNYNHQGSKPLYPLIDAPVYARNGGSVPANFMLEMTNPNGSGLIYYTTDGSDPRLVGGATNSSASVATEFVTLTHSGRVKARVLDAGTWSALNDFEFIVGIAGAADNLVISELHYHPSSTPEDVSLDRGDYEFIELLNLSETDPIELTGTRFVAGITFDFTGSNVIQLPPGGRVVVVSNLDRFIERYPSVSPSLVAGQYVGNLDNAGERVTLVDSEGSAIKDFSYSDDLPWPTAADGEGYSLVLNVDDSNPDHNLSENWRSHGTLHGNPGEPDGLSWDEWVQDQGVSGQPDADSDQDTISDEFEYAAGTDPLDPASKSPLVHSFESFFVDGTYQEFSAITVQRNLGAGDIYYYPEISSDLLTWSSSELVMVESINQGDGTELVTWRSSLPVPNPGGEQRYMRLRIEGDEE